MNIFKKLINRVKASFTRKSTGKGTTAPRHISGFKRFTNRLSAFFSRNKHVTQPPRAPRSLNSINNSLDRKINKLGSQISRRAKRFDFEKAAEANKKYNEWAHNRHKIGRTLKTPQNLKSFLKEYPEYKKLHQQAKALQDLENKKLNAKLQKAKKNDWLEAETRHNLELTFNKAKANGNPFGINANDTRNTNHFDLENVRAEMEQMQAKLEEIKANKDKKEKSEQIEQELEYYKALFNSFVPLAQGSEYGYVNPNTNEIISDPEELDNILSIIATLEDELRNLLN